MRGWTGTKKPDTVLKLHNFTVLVEGTLAYGGFRDNSTLSTQILVIVILSKLGAQLEHSKSTIRKNTRDYLK